MRSNSGWLCACNCRVSEKTWGLATSVCGVVCGGGRGAGTPAVTGSRCGAPGRLWEQSHPETMQRRTGGRAKAADPDSREPVRAGGTGCWLSLARPSLLESWRSAFARAGGAETRPPSVTEPTGREPAGFPLLLIIFQVCHRKRPRPPSACRFSWGVGRCGGVMDAGCLSSCFQIMRWI